MLLCDDPAEYRGDAALNYGVLSKCDVPIERIVPANIAQQLEGAAWIVDALLGTGARGEPREPYATVIDQLNASGLPILAVDVPSGLDCDSGRISNHTIRAAHTCTFVAAKPGFLLPESRPYVGQLHVADIGAPRKLVEAILGKAADATR